ncbi:MAG: adenylate/guanylate cyclase domain-containing protein [Nitrospinota bacterium]|nr:adenylate/guanylate cyclase domain-containing protein [Nitrospinota bacterium]
MDDKDIPKIKTENIDIDTLLREKEKIDSLIKRKFTREITVMFTDLSGSTQMSEELGDLAMRAILKRHHDIIRPLVESNNGVLVKTMGDGTMSYFENAADAVNSAIQIQNSIMEFNEEKGDPLLLIRCGLNTGMGIVEKTDVYGDVVNVAQRYEALATAREILISVETYEMVKDVPGITVVFLKETNIKGKGDIPKKVYKVLWDPEDVERYAARIKSGEMVTFKVDGEEEEEENEGSEAKTAVGFFAPRLMIEQKGKSAVFFEIDKDEMVIGRSSKTDIQLPEVYISRRHAKVVKEGEMFYIEDLDSNVGTVFKGQKIKRQELRHGDEFSIGSVRLVFMSERIGERKEPLANASEKIVGVDTDATMHIDRKKVFLVKVFEGNTMVAKHELRDIPLLIGRVNECDVRLGNPAVSRQHARIYTVGETVIVEDLKSNNGTYVNGSNISKVDVGIDDEIRIGPFTIFIIDPSQQDEEEKSNKLTLAEKMLSFLHKK